MPVSKGRVPAAEAFSSKLTSLLNEVDGVLDRQIVLINWFFEQYSKLLPSSSIIKYEYLIRSKGQVLSVACPSASKLEEKLVSKNNNDLYDEELKKRLRDKLLQFRDAYFWNFYKPEDLLF